MKGSKVKRRDKFEVRVLKEDGMQLGITTCRADGEFLIICGIVDGLVQNYNAEQPADSRVEVGDRIISVNGEAAALGKLEKMICEERGYFSFEIQTHTMFTVKINRGE